MGTVGQHDLAANLEADPALELPLRVHLRELLIPAPEFLQAEYPLFPVVQLGDAARQLQQRRENDACHCASPSESTLNGAIVHGLLDGAKGGGLITVELPDTGLPLPVRKRRRAVRVHLSKKRQLNSQLVA